MHHTHLEAIQVVQKLSYRLDKKDYQAVDVAVFPAFTALRSVQTTLDSDKIPIALGAQNCHWEPQGAFTGEVSAPMLAKLNCRFVIVGHSERRELFGETDEMVAKKVRAVLGAGMTPVLCVGETRSGTRAHRDRCRARSGLRSALPRCAGVWSPTSRIGASAPAAMLEDANAAVGREAIDEVSAGAGPSSVPTAQRQAREHRR
jgi:triosephosphate isomerase